MDFFKQDMKAPIRSAPPVPGLKVNRYSPVTNWNDDPFGTDLFEPTPMQKKKPPPRPPPPKLNSKQPAVPAKPTHFLRKPTVLSSLLSRSKSKTPSSHNLLTTANQNILDINNSEIDATKYFTKCELKNMQTGVLIDLSSPPSSPTFTTRSSSDGLSVDSFGSDATTSTNHHNAHSNGNASQAESGFEDDFDLFLNSRKNISKTDTFDDFSVVDPFSPPPVVISKPAIMKRPIFNKDNFESPYAPAGHAANLSKGPTIIRAKPARPKPPENSAILKTTLGNHLPATMMNVNVTMPIHKVYSFADDFDSKSINWDSSPEREESPPMPSMPPPPPPADLDLQTLSWSDNDCITNEAISTDTDNEPYAIALFDYHTDHHEDLNFSANAKIRLLRRIDDEWLYGRLRNGTEGMFPSNYVQIKTPLPDDKASNETKIAIALYDMETLQPGDLRFKAGDRITVKTKISDEWYMGECNGATGQFPFNYVQMS